MRALFSFVGGRGHLEPLVPFARGVVAAGHTVAVASAPATAPAVRAAGLEHLPLGAGHGRPPASAPLRPVDRAREARDLRERFARRAARDRVPRVAALAAAWEPDVLVCDETDFGALVAAERLALPFATVQVIAAGAFVRPDVVGEPLDALRREHGLPADPGLTMLHRHLVLSPFPRSFRHPGHPPPPTAHAFRPAAVAAGAEPPPARALPDAPTVYLTLGTIFQHESGDLFARALAGLAELPVNVIATTGPGVDPAVLGPQPDHVRVAAYLPQARVLPACDAVVCHGGSGSVIGALAHGLPLVVIPLGADQPDNAERCEALGVGRAIDAMEATPAGVGRATADVLGDPGMRRRARALRDEIAALPGPERAVPLLEALATRRARR